MNCNVNIQGISFEDRLRAYAEKQLSENNCMVEFSDEITEEISSTLTPAPCLFRLDLRNVPCFTIDCDDTKDMDDAVSLEQTSGGYRLGVHIADVAAYIPMGTSLDLEAFLRGTSIYLPHQTIPMLPAVLSNDLCSLNPNVDRLTVSVLIDLDYEGNIKEYNIQKSMIHSILKGKYSEVNSLLEGKAVSTVREAYSTVAETLPCMQTLAAKLRKARGNAGANCTPDNESKIAVNDWTIDIIPNTKGIAEQIIEEFMILANRLVAEYFIENNLPVVFRAQTEKGTVAIYTTEECHHAELALDHYAHFTSPIRRLADLKIHQVLAEHLNGKSSFEIHAMYDEHLEEAADRAKRRKGTADNIMTACRNFCIKMWAEMNSHEIFSARVVGFNNQNRVIIEIMPYRIKVLGEVALRAYNNKTFSCKLITNYHNNKLLAVAVA